MALAENIRMRGITRYANSTNSTASLGGFWKTIILFLCTFGTALTCTTSCKCLLKGVLNNTSQMSYLGLFTTDLPSVGDNGGTHIA